MKQNTFRRLFLKQTLVILAEKDAYVEKCCYGYCIQLLQAVSSALNFSYSLYLSPDGKFGNYRIVRFFFLYTTLPVLIYFCFVVVDFSCSQVSSENDNFMVKLMPSTLTFVKSW